MDNIGSKDSKFKREEEGNDIKIQVWKYIFGFVEMAVIKCAIELKIADTIDAHGGLMTLPELSSSLNCSPLLLRRILRFLIHRGIFKEEPIKSYAQTPMSRLLTSSGAHSLAPIHVLESSLVMLAPWHNLSAYLKANNGGTQPFEMAHGKDLWSYCAANSSHNMVMNEGMASFSRVVIVPAVLERCGGVFEGVGSLVDVGGGNGSCLSVLVKAFPWIRGINFDLPHVVSVSQEYEGVRHVGGNMFDFVPKADAAFIMNALHDWDDEECIKILKNCKEAIPEKTGKVIIVEVVIDEKEESMVSDVRLMLDMIMIAHTIKGKERTREEWAYVLQGAGFSRHTITPTSTIQSIIQGFV
ncbi:(RS)-norcoclaurine 6-O-methyltransferase-like isoform X1 [Cucurbita maxima]|uniref:(RS)-norcoclaurine 6-O-methyltransferase-like isoform X1 n=2 Tax=Cucurbita maxima TaxID=3661 RepID=A0A6J1HWX9_CUCMA|nr:(RS)-norcoclaurine 6-O-methyltransferase-like isoform X1 [Cucurbita maxima]